jgi:hypothetical protein
VNFRTERAAAIALALARLLFCAYRAAEQSITIDEAYTYERFLAGGWGAIYGKYDANNHVLYSILAKLSMQTLGLSEFALRLPSLIAGFFLVLGIFELLRIAVRSPAVRWVAFVALSLHPLLLDFSIAARGYGIALAFLVWSIYFAMRRGYLASGSLLGLAISANLTMVFPAAGVLGAVLLLDPVPWKERVRNVAVMVAPAQTIFWAICFGAVRSAEARDFYAGLKSPEESIAGLIETSFVATRRGALLGGESMRHLFQFAILPALSIFITAAAAVALFKNRKDGLRLVPVVALALASGVLVAAHGFLGTLYPADRTGLYLVLLFALGWAVAADLFPKLRGANLALGCIVALQFVTQLHGGYFTLWRDGSRIKDAALALQRVSARRAAGSVRISTSWYHQAAMEFYRQRWNVAQWAPIVRHEPTQFTGYDFYVLKDEDPQKIKDAGIRILFRDARTGLVVGMNWPAAMRP